MTNELPGLEPLLDEVSDLADRFAEAGASLYLVGGVVRDLLLELPLSGDLDFTTEVRPPVIKQLLDGWADAVWSQGERFGTIGASRRHRNYEITTFRADAYDPASRKPEVSFGENIAVDLSRRDFTVNAMAIDARTRELVDPHGGRADLARRVLRTPLVPSTSFSDDPLRMLRAARFVARLGLTPDHSILHAIEAMRSRIDIVSDERIHDELQKLLAVDDPTDGLELLLDTHLADEIWPELAPRALPAIAAVPADPTDRFATAMLFAPDPAGSTGMRAAALRQSGDERRRAQHLVRAASELAKIDGAADSDVRRWIRSVGADRDAVLTIADQVPALTAGAAAVRAASSRLGPADLDSLDVTIAGETVMRRLGVEPGPIVGRAIDHLREVRLNEGPLTDDELLDRLDAWWSDQG